VEAAAALRDGDGEATSSLTAAAAAAETQHAEGHGSVQYAAAQPGTSDMRYGPCLYSCVVCCSLYAARTDIA